MDIAWTVVGNAWECSRTFLGKNAWDIAWTFSGKLSGQISETVQKYVLQTYWTSFLGNIRNNFGINSSVNILDERRFSQVFLGYASLTIS